MPGPGSHKKAKPKSKPSAKSASTTALPLQPEAYVGDINDAGGWGPIANIICLAFDIPDLTTRSGLKKVHANFDAIYRKLEKECQRFTDNEKFIGGVVVIYSKMCADAILRNKLHERGLLNKLLPLLDLESSRHMALRALSMITHHGGTAIRKDIAKQTTSTLLRIIDQFPDDSIVGDLVVSVLCHSVSGVLEGDTITDTVLYASLDMRRILKVVTETSKKEWASSYLISHAIGLLATATLHASDACKGYPPMLRYLVAGLRSRDWVTRCTCLGGILRLHRSESVMDMRTLDPMKFISCVQRGFPTHLQDRMIDYGFQKCDTFLTLATSRDYQQAMMACAQDRNLYSLGLKIASFILRTEFSVADGMFQSEDPKTGKLEVMDIGLPFIRWVDALPHCARAIRAKGVANEEDLADILDIKYHIMKQRIPAAVEVARKGLKRNPGQAYFYYAITLSADHTEGLRAAKKGLKCKQITPFVRFQLMQRAVEHAGDMGIMILQDSPAAGKAKWEEGIAFLMSAHDDAKVFADEAPPDNRHMNAVLYWLILLTITINGPDLSTDLKELQSALKSRKIADEFCKAIDIVPPNTNLRLGQETVVKHYSAAAAEFDRVIIRASADDEHKAVSPEKLDDDLARWLDGVHLHDEPNVDVHHIHPKINTNSVGLYRCSYCGNPSAALRKCGGCSQTRYCDGGCQKLHWSDHKKTCAQSERAP